MADQVPSSTNLQTEKVLLEWSSVARPYKTRSREFYTTVLSIAFLLGIILLLLKEFLLIGVIIAFAFLSYVLSSVKPEEVQHQITTYGVRTDNKLYRWEELTNFWLQKQLNHEVVIIKTTRRLPDTLIMVVDEGKRAEIVKQIGAHIPLDQPEDSIVDRASRWLGEKIPLEN